MKSHLETCSSCAKFHDALNKGVSMIYQSGEILAPPGFRDRIVRSIRESDAVQPITPAPAGLAAAGMVAAAVALLVFEFQTKPETTAQISVPAAEILHTQLVPLPQIPRVSFTEHELPPIVELQPLPEISQNDDGDQNDISRP